MLFVLAIAGQDRSRLAAQLTQAALTKTVDVVEEKDSQSAPRAAARAGRTPAAVARTLDIEPVLPGGE